ncbi:MAG: hypothetical protein IJH76_00355 [Clostridia bacterium]|nr:hypothetical protein [Clostridia bacterium]
MKGKLFQKSIALVLVLCMTLVNFLFVAVNTAYAVSEQGVSIENGNIIFDAYLKNESGSKKYEKDSKITDGEKLYISIALRSGVFENEKAKITINNANFTLPDKLENQFVESVDKEKNEIYLKGLNASYVSNIDLEIPITFKRQASVDMGYFDRENEIVLSGRYKNSDSYNDINPTVNIKINWYDDIERSNTRSFKKIFFFDDNLQIIEEEITSKTSNLPKLYDRLNIVAPKVLNSNPNKIVILKNGDKVDYKQNVGEFEYTYNFVNNNNIDWSNDVDVYRIIYIYNQAVADKDTAITKGTEQISTKFLKYDNELTSKVFSNDVLYDTEEHYKTISTVTAEAQTTDAYKGYMYAGTKNTEYKEKYEMEISYVDGITAELNLAGEKFKTDNGDIETNKTQYKEIVLNKADLLIVLGNTGILTLTPDNDEERTITINKLTLDDENEENSNIVISFKENQMPHNVKFSVSNAENEGTIRINATKEIIGNAGLEKASLNQIKAIETTVATRTNKDKEGLVSTATATTELKESTTEVNLTMNNNNSNSLTEAKANNVEFIATIKTGTIDADVVTNPTIKLQLPEEVTNIENVSANVFFAGENAAVENTVEGKTIIVKLQGEQLTNGNAFVDGIQIKINADITVADIENSKDSSVVMIYTNESSAQAEYTKQLPITIIASENQNPQTEPTNPTNQEEPATEPSGEIVSNEKLKVNVVAKSADKELKENDEVYESQVIRYTYYLTNTSNEDITNVKITVNHENANVFEQVTKSQPITWEATYEEETEKSNIERTIETIKPGKTELVTYQVRVKNGVNVVKANATISGTGIENIVYTSQNTVKPAELKVSTLNNRSKDFPLSEGEYLYNEVKITNLTNNTLNNITVNVNIPSEFKVGDIFESDSHENKEFTENESKKSLSFNIGKIESQAEVNYTIELIMKDKKPTENNTYFKANATVNQHTYYSNELEIGLAESIESTVVADIRTTNKEEVLKTGDKPSFVISLKNTSIVTDKFRVTFDIPNAVVVKRAYIINSNRDVLKEIDITNINLNTLIEEVELNANEIKYLVVETEIDESMSPLEQIELYARISGNMLANDVITEKITYKLQTNIPYHPDDDIPTPDPSSDPSSESNPGQVETKYNISGVVWVDQNKNGIRESNEKTLPGIKVILANDLKNKSFLKDESGNIVEATTNQYGEYKFSNLPNGEYMAVFAFDNVKYRSTEYHSAKATDATNSDITTSKLLTNDSDTKYGLTDTLVIKDKSLENIDAGLIENEIFDLSMNKYINKVTVQNSSGTTVKEYNKQKLAKLEIDSKKLAGSTLLIEYDIDVKNEGEIAGYANELIDYMPKDLTFSSELNKDWYISTDGNLHTTTLSKELIEPGETKTVTLILTKTMTEKNTGLTSNKAEIVKSTNETLIPDRNANNNSSTGELIVSIRTGVDTTIGIIITLIAIAATGIVVYTKARKGASHE